MIEVTSPKTRRVDLGRKRDLYARLRVAEYVLYDPLGEYLRPALQGLALVGGAYRPMPQDTDGAFLSGALGLRLRMVEGRLRLEDRATGQTLLSPEEHAAEAEDRAKAEREGRQRAEERVAELEAELRRRDASR